MPGHIEIESWINAETVERATARARAASESNTPRGDAYATCGLRAARARDPKLLLALEKGAEVLDKMAEAQQGRTRRSTDVEGLKVEFTETQLWKRAYEQADKGGPDIPHYAWIYAAAAILAGFIS